MFFHPSNRFQPGSVPSIHPLQGFGRRAGSPGSNIPHHPQVWRRLGMFWGPHLEDGLPVDVSSDRITSIYKPWSFSAIWKGSPTTLPLRHLRSPWLLTIGDRFSPLNGVVGAHPPRIGALDGLLGGTQPKATL